VSAKILFTVALWYTGSTICSLNEVEVTTIAIMQPLLVSVRGNSWNIQSENGVAVKVVSGY
jgi:hypothetical protein